MAAWLKRIEAHNPQGIIRFAALNHKLGKAVMGWAIAECLEQEEAEAVR